MKTLAGLLALLLAATGAFAQDDGDAVGKKLEAVVASRADSIVTVRLVLELKVQNQKQEIRNDILGVVVGENGLIMAANDAVNPEIPSNPQYGPIEITPVDVKIVIGNEEKEHDAFVAAKDTKLGLAFLQIKKPEDLKLKVVSFDEKRTPALGEQLVGIGRRSKGYDYAPYVSLMRVSGKITKPRKALGTMGMALPGLPVFDLEDRCVGVHVPIDSGVAAARPGGDPESQVFVIAPSIVAAVVKQAARRAADALEQIAEGKEAPAPAAEETDGSAPADEPVDEADPADGTDDAVEDGSESETTGEAATR